MIIERITVKILFMTNIPSPYRVKFFSQLGRKCDLTVLYEMNRARNRNKNWKEEYTSTFREIYMHTHQMIDDGGISMDIFRYLKKNQYDFIIVGTHGTPTAKLAMLYMRLCHIPYILNIDGMLSAEIPDKSRVNKFLRKVMFQGASAYITSGEDTKKYLEDLGIHLSSDTHIYHFSSVLKDDILKDIPSSEKKSTIKKRLGIRERKMIISVARFIPKKGLDGLIKAFQEIKYSDVALVLIGGNEDVYTTILKKIPEKVRSRIYFPGFMSKEKLYQYYQAADIFVLPTHHDEWGLVINEAVATALPVITTNRCGAGLEMIKNGENGYIVNHVSKDELKHAIVGLLDDSAKCAQMAENNLRLAHEYTIEKMVEDHLRIFREMLNDN